MEKKPAQIDIHSFPPGIQNLLANANVYDSSCSSSANVLYLDTGYYLKMDDPGLLAGEAELGRFFHSRGLGVEVIDYISGDQDYLITRSAVGADLTHFLHDPEKLCGLLAASLRKLHSQSVRGAPLSSRFQRYMDSADGDCSGGHYDESVLMNRFMVNSKEEAWALMQSGRHLLRADTLIHGDACLPNIIQDQGRFSAFIDFNMSGIGDRHIDLYWAIWSLQYNLKTDAWTDLLLDMYGREHISEEALRVVAAFELFG